MHKNVHAVEGTLMQVDVAVVLSLSKRHSQRFPKTDMWQHWPFVTFTDLCDTYIWLFEREIFNYVSSIYCKKWVEITHALKDLKHYILISLNILMNK